MQNGDSAELNDKTNQRKTVHMCIIGGRTRGALGARAPTNFISCS